MASYFSFILHKIGNAPVYQDEAAKKKWRYWPDYRVVLLMDHCNIHVELKNDNLIFLKDRFIITRSCGK